MINLNFLKKAAGFVEGKKILFILFPIVPLVIAFLLYYHPPLDLIPVTKQKGSKKLIHYGVYDDRNKGGNSISSEIPDKEGIAYKYELREGLQYPFSGITFYKNKQAFFDLSHFDYVKINIRASKGKRLPFILFTYIENYTRPDDFNTLMNSQAILNVEPESEEIVVKMSALKTPEWWYTFNNKSESYFNGPDFGKVYSINISNCIALGNNKEDAVEVKEISFQVNLLPFFLFSLVFITIYYITGIFLLRKNKTKTKEITFLYEKTETVNRLEKEEEAIFQFLTTQYNRPELAIVDVQKACGLSEQKISLLIRKKTDLNFKQFLNKLRISEAKRLLRETDLQISEIAFRVGYGNISHFNRVFKELEKCSPNDFRKQEATIS